LKTLYRYIRAFFLALKLTLQGAQPPRQHPLVNWTKQMAILTEAVINTLEQCGIDKAARESLKLRLDGRKISLETVLATVRFHAAQEYPMLLQGPQNRDAFNTFYASNMNDRYWISQLAEADALKDPTIHAAIMQLKTHLDQPPPM
jgi:hypothetical protein